MADSKDNTSTNKEEPKGGPLEAPATVSEKKPEPQKATTAPTVDQVDQGSPRALEDAVNNPDKQLLAAGDKKLGVGENLYFFPDIQKSVVAKNYKDALQQVQSEIDEFNKKDNK